MISFGEGIIAGFFYAIFAIVFLVKLAQEDSSNIVLYVMNGLIIAMSILLAVGNACQMGLVDQVNVMLVFYAKTKGLSRIFCPQYVPRVGDFPETKLLFIHSSEVSNNDCSHGFCCDVMCC